MKPYWTNEQHGLTIYLGDAIDVLYTDFVQLLASEIEPVAFCDIFVGEAFRSNHSRRAVAIGEIPVADHLSSMFAARSLQVPEFQKNIRLFEFDHQEWQQGTEDGLRRSVRRLVAEERFALSGVRLLLIVPPSKRLGNEADRLFVNHSHLYPGVVAGSGPSLATVCLHLFDAEVCFSVH